MFLFYVEESGERDYNPKSSDPFVLLASGIDEADWHDWNIRINLLKAAHFGTRGVKIKSNYMRNPKEQKRFYLAPYKIDQNALKIFTDAFYELADAAPLTLFAIVIDKPLMMRQYARPASATTLAYEMLMERIQTFLERQAEKPYGLIIHDLINDSSGNARTIQKEIVDLHEKFLHTGKTDYKAVPNLIEGVHFIPDDQSNFLQFSDFMAYNVLRQFRFYGEEWDRGQPIKALPKYAYFERILPKFFTSDAGEIRGWGIKKFPEKK